MIRTISCKNIRGFGIKQILILISALTLFSCVTWSKLFNFPLPFCTTCKIGIIPILIGCWEHWREYVKYWQRRLSVSGTYYHCPFVVSEFLRTDSPFLSSIVEPGTRVTLCVSKGLWLKVPKQELNIRYEKERAGPGALETFTSVKDSVRPGWCSEKLDIARCNSHKDCGSRHQVQQHIKQRYVSSFSACRAPHQAPQALVWDVLFASRVSDSHCFLQPPFSSHCPSLPASLLSLYLVLTLYQILLPLFSPYSNPLCRVVSILQMWKLRHGHGEIK